MLIHHRVSARNVWEGVSKRGGGSAGPPPVELFFFLSFKFWVLKMAYLNWNDSKIWNILSFSLPTRGGIPPCGAERGGPDPLAETLHQKRKQPYYKRVICVQTLQSVATPLDFGPFRVVRPFLGHTTMSGIPESPMVDPKINLEKVADVLDFAHNAMSKVGPYVTMGSPH